MTSNKRIDILKGYLKGRYRAFVKVLLNNSSLARKVLLSKDYAAGKSEYCYEVWMKHFKHWLKLKTEVPDVVVEIGSGYSLGVGLAALLSGASKFYALEKTQFWNNSTNVRVFDDLVEMFKNRRPSKNYDHVIGNSVSNPNFPDHVLSDKHLEECLSEERINTIRQELDHPHDLQNKYIRSVIPWIDEKPIDRNSVDLICSQSVLQHVMDLDFTYLAMRNWLKPTGCMSHTVDFSCMNTSKLWNGHWTYDKKTWKIVTGGTKLINREALSTHLKLLSKNNFKVKFKQLTKMKNTLLKTDLAKRYRKLKDIDLTTSGIYFFAEKVEIDSSSLSFC